MEVQSLEQRLSQAEATERELRENWLEDMQEWSVEKANLMDVAGKMAGALKPFAQMANRTPKIRFQNWDCNGDSTWRQTTDCKEECEKADKALASWQDFNNKQGETK